MASSRTELNAPKNLISEAELILSTAELPHAARRDAPSFRRPLWLSRTI
jgi:hypothetical protein